MTTDKAIRQDARAPEQGNSAPAYRLAPHNMEAEQGLLGALMVDNRALENVSDFLEARHFYVPAHQRIYEAILKLNERGQSATPVTLKNYFEQDSDLSELGGADYLAQLAASVVTVINAGDYARTIYDLYLRRELITVGEEIVKESYEHDLERDAINTIETAESRLFALAETGNGRSGFVTLRDSVMVAIENAQKAYENEGHVSGVTTGLRDMDQKLGGLHPSDLVILAGRPAMGKTALATNIAFNAAKAYAEGRGGGIVGFFSLEMSSDQLATRILAEQSGVSGDAIRRGDLTQDDFHRFIETSQTLAQIPLHIDDTPALSIAAVRTRARRLKRKHGLDLLVVDYLQLLRGNGSRQSAENRVLEVSEITRGLKAIAKELHIPVLALSQLSRAVEQREDKRPQLADLRESGSIEQDADVVMFVYREEYYLANGEPTQHVGESDDKFFERHESWATRLQSSANLAEAIVAKQRHGPTGSIKMFFDRNLTRFGDLDQHHGG